MSDRSTSPQQAYAGFYSVIAPLIMDQGTGDGKTTACVMAQAATIDALRKGKTLAKPTDEMECACPLLRRLAISLNDNSWWTSNEERTENLRPLIPLLLDSRGSFELTKRRAARWTDAVIRELTPMRLEFIAAHTKSADLKKNALAGAEKCRTLVVTDKASALKAREALSGLRSYASAYASASASAYASASASADADASASADAYASASADADADASASADADADASASASADASAYAYAYAYASAYADASASAYASAYASAKNQKIKYRDLAISIFKEIAAMKD